MRRLYFETEEAGSSDVNESETRAQTDDMGMPRLRMQRVDFRALSS